MLLELSIKDLAIIDDLTVSLGPGLNVFTGETGAGKSILIDAIELVLGDRASTELIRSSSDEARVEAEFDISDRAELARVLEDSAVPAGENLVIKRIIQRNGRNRVFINGSLTPLTALAEIGRRLIDIYGQSEHQDLKRPEEHIEILDGFGGFSKQREKMASAFRVLTALDKELAGLRSDVERAGRERELLSFQSREIEEAALTADEEKDLGEERERLRHSEDIRVATTTGESTLYSDEGSVVERVGEVIKSLKEVGRFDKKLEEAAETLETCLFNIEDASTVLRDVSSSIESDPGRIEEVESRLDLIGKLKRKYNGTVEEVLEKKVSIDAELETLFVSQDRIKELEASAAEAREAAASAADELTKARRKAAAALKKALERELGELGMKGTVFKALVTAVTNADGEPRLTEKGADSVVFMISPNPGEELKPLARIASGGELSRIMLALKSITAAGRVPTLIFDEVDTGVGGAMAQVVGRKLDNAARTHQVLCITHLPQITAYADRHFSVTKGPNSEGRTVTEVREIKRGERVEAIARMLGGTEVTETMMKHARELIETAGKA